MLLVLVLVLLVLVLVFLDLMLERVRLTLVVLMVMALVVQLLVLVLLVLLVQPEIWKTWVPSLEPSWISVTLWGLVRLGRMETPGKLVIVPALWSGSW